MLDIESWLGAYPQLAQSLDNAPRPSDYIAIYKNIQKETASLLNALSDMNMFYREQFDHEKQSLTLSESEKMVASIGEVSNAIVNKYIGISAKGAKKNSALFITIAELRAIFSKYYRGQEESGEKRKAFEPKSTKDKNEILFIEAILLDARIIPDKNFYKSSYKITERYLSDKRCILR